MLDVLAADPAASLPAGIPPWIVAVTLLPMALVMVTAFARISIALAFLRHGLGIPEIPSGLVVTGLSVLLTLVAMAPTLLVIEDQVVRPYQAGRLDRVHAARAAWDALSDFMRAQTRRSDQATVLGLLRERGLEVTPEDARVQLPAFVLSELKSGFQIGLVLWVPFLVVDLLAGAVLSTLALSVEVRRVALPVKLLLFVAVDGWSLLVTGLVRSFAGGV
jgi:flagellar biosynthetic protein FliP